MAKDRNTMAKRQREMEKKRKANQKRDRRAEKKRVKDEPADDRPQPELSPEECKVLSIFREFMMSPGRMLCFSSSDVDTYRIPLAALAAKGLLVPEKFSGGYSLTQNGFDAMQRCA